MNLKFKTKKRVKNSEQRKFQITFGNYKEKNKIN